MKTIRQIDKEIKMTLEGKKNLNKRRIFIGLGVLIAILIFAGVFFYIPFSYSATEIYYEQNPYTTQDCQNVNLKFAWEMKAPITNCLNNECESYKSVCTNTNFWGNCLTYSQVCQSSKCTKYEAICSLEITNVDDTAGSWTVNGYATDSKLNTEFIDSVSIYVQPSKTEIASWKFDYLPENVKQCDVNSISPSTKQVCKDKIAYNTLQKERAIIKKDTWYNQIAGKTQYVFYEQETSVLVTA